MAQDNKTDPKPDSEPVPAKKPYRPIKVPERWKDTTAEHLGTTIAIIGGQRPGKAKPKG